MKEKKLVLKNYYLVPLLSWLNSGSLPGGQSRYRTRFTNMCRGRLKEIEDTRMEFLVKHAEKDKDNKPKFKMVKNDKGEITELEPRQYDIFPENLEKFNKEYQTYMLEDFIIDILPSTETTLQGIKDILLLTLDTFSNKPEDVKVKFMPADLYNEICETFEKYII